MSNSDRLSQIIKDNDIASEKSKKWDKKVFFATNKAFIKLQNNYTGYTITKIKQLPKTDIIDKVKSQFLDSSIGTNISSNTRGIAPDGGVIILNGKYFLGATEAKKQGTNDKRAEEGKKKQAKGNAIERSFKNFYEIVNYLMDEDIFPYLFFMKGCDLEDKASYIRDRITAMLLYSDFDKLYIAKIADNTGKLCPRASIFIGDKSIDDMANIIYEMLEFSIKYYIKKYSLVSMNLTE